MNTDKEKLLIFFKICVYLVHLWQIIFLLSSALSASSAVLLNNPASFCAGF